MFLWNLLVVLKKQAYCRVTKKKKVTKFKLTDTTAK